MGCKCGTQVILCNLPVRFDTYKGCSHGCKYCFAQKKQNVAKIQRDETVEALRKERQGNGMVRLEYPYPLGRHERPFPAD